MDGILTLQNIARQTDASGKVPTFVDFMAEQCPMINDASAITGNLDTGHQVFQTLELPEGEYTGYNEGTKAESSKGRDLVFTTGSHTGKLVIHEKLYRNEPNAKTIFGKEAENYVIGMTRRNQKTMLYGDTAKTPKGFDGFYKYYNDMSDEIYGSQVYDCGGTGIDNASILFVSWSANETTIITPKGSKAGVQIMPRPDSQIPDKNGKLFTAKVTDLELNMGLSFGHPKAVVRAANISMSELKSNPQQIFRNLILAEELLESQKGKVVMYCPKSLMSWLTIAAFEKQNAYLTYDEIDKNKKIVRWNGWQIKHIHAMTTFEQRVV